MEPIGAIVEGEWSSLGGMYTTEEAEFMAQLLGNCSSFPSELDGGIPSFFWENESMNCSSDVSNNNLPCFSQGSSSYYSGGSSSSLFPNSSPGNYYLSDYQQVLVGNINNCAMTMDFFIDDEKKNSLAVQVFTDGLMEDCSGNLPEMLVPPSDDKDEKMPENPKKRMRESGDVQKNKRRNVKTKKKKKKKENQKSDEEDKNGDGINGQQSSSSYCSEEDESIASQEMNGSSSPKGSATLTLNGKARAGRGSATDPQSLYARKRRERINERLKILQNLVPNGTKVDISTMLEEAVQYVKFLQLQIKLLSSDDLWMYAPLAYNGMDIGLDLKIALPRK